jgi:hypothetical protein
LGRLVGLQPDLKQPRPANLAFADIGWRFRHACCTAKGVTLTGVLVDGSQGASAPGGLVAPRNRS